MLPRDGKTVEELSVPKRNRVFAAVAEQVAVALDHSRGARPTILVEWDPYRTSVLREPQRDGDDNDPVDLNPVGRRTYALDPEAYALVPSALDEIDITRLPVTGAELFGRSEELAWLDELWEKATVKIATLVAWGGVGKSTLVNKWLERMERDGFRGARKVFGWTFYSQGTGERVASADFFLNEALRFFGDPEPDSGSPWSKENGWRS
jgi:hypothetical protein